MCESRNLDIVRRSAEARLSGPPGAERRPPEYADPIGGNPVPFMTRRGRKARES